MAWTSEAALSNLLIGMAKQSTAQDLRSCLRRNLISAYEDGLRAAQEVAYKADQGDLARAIISLRDDVA